jgi:plastocyanin domain-containing protein
MYISQLTTLLSGLAIIIFVAWYFFGKKDDDIITSKNSTVSIKVDGGYSPSTIQVSKGKPVTLKIFRTDPSDCLDTLVIPQWGINRPLPLNRETTITFTPEEVGEFPFRCGMNMFHGKIVVKE